MGDINDMGKAAGSVSAILGLGALLFKPVRKRMQARKAFREELSTSLKQINRALEGLADDIADLQYERLSQAQDFYTSRGWCPGAKKEMLCKMHASYRAKGRNHLSEHYEEEILRLADKPPQGEKGRGIHE